LVRSGRARESARYCKIVGEDRGWREVFMLQSTVRPLSDGWFAIMKIIFTTLALVVPLALSATSTASAEVQASCSWRARCAYPHLVLGVDAGVGHFAEGSPFGFGTGTGSITRLGPAWGLRGGVEITRWFALEAHYMGMSNRADDSVSTGGSRSLFTNAVAAELRFTAPTPYVQPYLFFGPGWYWTSVSGSSSATQLTRSNEFGAPIGVGFQIPLGRGISLGAEATYHRLFGESFSENEDIGGGDPFSLNAALRFRL
jgi:Outer membrane protein beta-barrel domain